MADDTSTNDAAAPVAGQEPVVAQPSDMSFEDWLAQQQSGISMEDWLAQTLPSTMPTAGTPVALPAARRPHPSGGIDITKLPTGPLSQQFIGAATKADPLRINMAFQPGFGHWGNPDFYYPQYAAQYDPTGMEAWARLNNRRSLMGMY